MSKLTIYGDRQFLQGLIPILKKSRHVNKFAEDMGPAGDDQGGTDFDDDDQVKAALSELGFSQECIDSFSPEQAAEVVRITSALRDGDTSLGGEPGQEDFENDEQDGDQTPLSEGEKKAVRQFAELNRVGIERMGRSVSKFAESVRTKGKFNRVVLGR